MTARIPFYDPHGEEVGAVLVEEQHIKIREFKFDPRDSFAEKKRGFFALEVARFAPEGFGLIGTQTGVAPDDRAEKADGFLYDRFIFVRTGAFHFRTKDGLPPHRFTLKRRSDGLPYYMVERES
jgi:hypothetical protein